MYTYTHSRPALTVDCVVFGWDGTDLQILLIERGQPPFEGCWALPGGFVQTNEPLDTAALRELKEETGLDQIFLEQLYTFGAVDRDPRERIVTVAYYALVNLKDYAPPKGDSDARRAQWFPISATPPLAFDHKKILNTGLQRLRAKVRYQPIGFELLPEIFTLKQLQGLYEAITGQSYDRRNFRKKILSMGVLIEKGELVGAIGHRPPKIFSFDHQQYLQLEKEGLQFKI